MNKKTVLVSSLTVLALWSASLYYTFAIPPATPYNVAETLDPICAPGDPNCYVKIVDANNGLTLSSTNLVQLGGSLMHNTTVDTAGKEFSIKNGEVSFVSGADPLGLIGEVGAPVPGIGFVSDGISTNRLQSWIFSGKLPSPDNHLLNVFGNFDLATNRQSGMVVQNLETQLYSSDQFNSSGLSIRPTEIGAYTRGRIGLTADGEFNLYSNTGYLRFGNYYASRNDTTTTPSYYIGITERGTSFNSLGAANFNGSYTGASTETYRIIVDTAPGSTWTVGSTQYTNNLGSPNDVTFGGTYSGTNPYEYYYLNIESGGVTFNWSDGSGNNASGVPIVTGTPITLSQGVTVTFGSASYNPNESWSMNIIYNGAPSTTFSWNDGSGGSGSGVAIPVGGGIVSLSQGVYVEFRPGTFISGEEWHMTIAERGVPVGADNFLYTDSSGYLRQAPTSLLGGGGGFSLTSQDEGSTLITTTNTYNFIGAGVTATSSGNVVTVDIPGVIGGGDGSIYLNDGTLAGNRIVNGSGNQLAFANNSKFQAQAFAVDGFDGQTRSAGLFLDPRSTAATDQVGLFEGNLTTGLFSAVTVDDTKGVGFALNRSMGGSSAEYWFPLDDGLANQVLTTDGAGQLSWQNAGGGTNIYNSNGTLTGNRTVNGGGNSLSFAALDQFTAQTSPTLSSTIAQFGIQNNGVGDSSYFLATGSYINSAAKFKTSGFGTGDSQVDGIILRNSNMTDDIGALVSVNSNAGISFLFGNASLTSGVVGYTFPKTDGTGGQVLTTNGSSQLSWASLPTTPIAIGGLGPGLNSVLYSGGMGSTYGDQISGNGVYLGYNALGGVTNSTSNAVILGSYAGYDSQNATWSSFIGAYSGYDADSADSSNFLGFESGYNADDAETSNFIGYRSGYQATNASGSIFIGRQAGQNDSVNNTGHPFNFSILLGNNTSTGGFSNSIALGSHATNTASNQFMIGSTTRPIDQTKIIGSLGTECTITTGTGMACTSDQTLKTNILDLSTSILDSLLKVRTVTYNWLQNPDSPKQIGFLAQDLEQYFPELVTTDGTGKKAVYYSQITPILVEAIREMNLKITDIHATTLNSKSLADVLKEWFADAGNGIEKLFAKKIITEQLCVRDSAGESCYTRSQLDNVLHGTPTPVVTPPAPNTPQVDPTPLEDPTAGTGDSGDQTTPADNTTGTDTTTPPTTETPTTSGE